MEKTLENIKMVAKGTIEFEDGYDTFPLERFAKNYLDGEKFVPENDTVDELAGYVAGNLWKEFERYQPNDYEAWKNQAEKIPVIINGREFQTFLDEGGVQRFVGNSVINRMIDSMGSRDKMSLNTLAIDFHSGMFSNDEWLDFYTSTNYSVSGFMGLSDFSYLEIQNPLWEEASE